MQLRKNKYFYGNILYFKGLFKRDFIFHYLVKRMSRYDVYVNVYIP